MRAVHRWWTIVIPFLVAVQIALVGVGAFNAVAKVDDKFGGDTVRTCTPPCGKSFSDGVDNWFAPHIIFGYLLALSVILYAVFSLFTRDRRLMRMGGITVGLFLLQVVLAWLGDGVPALGWLHPLNALVILGYTGRNAYAAWQEGEDVQQAAATVPAA